MTRTLVASGSMSLSVGFDGAPYTTAHAEIACQASLAGAEVSFGGTFDQQREPENQTYTGGIGVTAQTGVAGQSDSDSYSVDHVHTPYPSFADGAWSVSVDVEEMMEWAPQPGPDAEHGVFHTVPPTELRIFYRKRVGGTATATASAGPVSATKTTTITSPDEVEAVYHVNVMARANGGMAGTVNASMTMVQISGGASAASPNCSATLDGGGAVQVNLPMGGYATAYTTQTRPRSFSLTGQVNSVGQPFPDPIDLDCSRFAGDTAAKFTSGSSISRAGTQQYMEMHVSATDRDGTRDFHDTGFDTRGSVQVTLDPAWCVENGEHVDTSFVDDYERRIQRDVTNNLVYMQGWSMPGLTLTQDSGAVVDACSAADWTGMALSGGALQNTAATATKTLAAPVDWSGYAHLRVRARCASGTATRTLTAGGKTWAVPLTATPTDVDLDLLNPLTGGADSDGLDTKWPFERDDTNNHPHNTASGPLSGLSEVASFGLSGMDATHPDTYTGFSLIRKDGGCEVNVMGEWAPRADHDMTQFWPERETDNGTVITDYVTRGGVADTDGRQSLEWAGSHVAKIESASTGLTLYSQDLPTIAGVAAEIQATLGWHAVINAPAGDGSDNLHDGFLHRDAPACWLMGNGLIYDSDAHSFKSGVGLPLGDGLGLPARPLFTTLVSWPADCGDVFGVAPPGAGLDGTIYLVASKVLRAQAHGALLKSSPGAGRASGKTVELYPAEGELQSSTTGVGRVTSGADGSYRTAGAGLIGQTTTGTPPATAGSAGVVKSGTRSGSVAVRSARLVRMALRVLAAPVGRRPTNAHGRTGPHHSAKVGAAGGVVYSRCDFATPAGPLAVTDLPAPADADPTDTEPRLAVGAEGRLHLHFTRPASGTRLAFSDDDGETWSDGVSLIPGGKHPDAAVTPTGTKIFSAYVGGNLQACVQHPGDAAPSAPVTLTDGAGAPLSVEDDGFSISAGHDGTAPLILHCLIAGDADTSFWACRDEGSLSFVRLA